MSRADGPALLAAAIRAACQEKAPRRTIQAVAAAVTGVLMRPTVAAEPRVRGAEPPGAEGAPDADLDHAGQVDALRAARRARRNRKKAALRAAKQTAEEELATHGDTAGQAAESWDHTAERSAQVSQEPPIGQSANSDALSPAASVQSSLLAAPLPKSAQPASCVGSLASPRTVGSGSIRSVHSQHRSMPYGEHGGDEGALPMHPGRGKQEGKGSAAAKAVAAAAAATAVAQASFAAAPASPSARRGKR